LKIAITVDPEIPVPPVYYGGIERIVEMLVKEMVLLGHDLTVFAHPDSNLPCKVIGWKGRRSANKMDTVFNATCLTKHVLKERFEVVHSFSRLAYMLPIMPSRQPKIMSYQREPSEEQISRAVKMSAKDSLYFTGCSNYISKQIEGIANSRTIFNCVQFNSYSPTKKVDDDAPLVFLGRIEAIKGTHKAIEIAVKSGKKLVIAGNVPTEGEAYFEKEIRPKLSDHVTYIGPVNDAQKNSLLRNASAFLMPIQWNEPFGIVMIEAMACGTPVIGFSRGSVPEVVDHGKTGWVCENDDAMVEAVSLIRNIDRENVRSIAENRFSSKVITNQYLDLYRSVKRKSKKFAQV
jgi:glycosyltransferase involved in cell wall biosynthesis